MRNIPGKTRAELDQQYKELQAQVANDMAVIGGYQSRHRRMDRGDSFMLGMLVGVVIGLVLSGGCRVGCTIKSNPTTNETSTLDSGPTDSRF